MSTLSSKDVLSIKYHNFDLEHHNFDPECHKKKYPFWDILLIEYHKINLEYYKFDLICDNIIKTNFKSILPTWC